MRHNRRICLLQREDGSLGTNHRACRGGKQTPTLEHLGLGKRNEICNDYHNKFLIWECNIKNMIAQKCKDNVRYKFTLTTIYPAAAAERFDDRKRRGRRRRRNPRSSSCQVLHLHCFRRRHAGHRHKKSPRRSQQPESREFGTFEPTDLIFSSAQECRKNTIFNVI